MMAQVPKPAAQPFLALHYAFRSGQDTPSALLERCLAAIDAREAEVQALTAINRDGARDAAARSTQRWRAGKPLSPVDGMPVGVKDVIETRDMPTQMGSALFAGHATGYDSASVRALREAGAVVLAKTVTTEFAATEPGPTRNPWDTARTPGGSSSGSAAGVAAGYFCAALGTQVVGSILRPASYCGVFGMKPTHGAINRGGSMDHMSQSVQGVLAATMADGWAVLRAIADRVGGDPGHPGLFGPDALPRAWRPRALAVLETSGWSAAGAGAKSELARAIGHLEQAGVEVLGRRDNVLVEAAEAALQRAMPLTRKLNAWESRWPLNTFADRDAGKLSRTMLDRLGEAEAMTLEDYRSALAGREAVRRVYERLADVVDAAITLAAPGEAPVGIESTGNPVFVVPGSLLGVPAVSLPLLACNGLPLGLQVLGYRDRDGALLATAAAIEGIVGTGTAVRA
jgi:Asp-tRNA(Asn)/Glu-tRNA(Gln) amidotransferase A subunit family amidase